MILLFVFFFFFQAEDGIRDATVTGVQTCALPISPALPSCGLYLPEEKAANSWVGGSRSISVSKQRAPGLAAVRICRCNSVGTIGTDSAHSLCPHSVMVFGTASVSSDAEREEPRDIRQVRLIARLAKVRPGRVAAKVFPF